MEEAFEEQKGQGKAENDAQGHVQVGEQCRRRLARGKGGQDVLILKLREKRPTKVRSPVGTGERSYSAEEQSEHDATVSDGRE